MILWFSSQQQSKIPLVSLPQLGFSCLSMKVAKGFATKDVQLSKSLSNLLWCLALEDYLISIMPCPSPFNPQLVAMETQDYSKLYENHKIFLLLLHH